jgi:hypothetical protein
LQAVPNIAQATPVVVVGNHTLLPNTAGQTIQINVTGGDPVSALIANFQIGDGGPPNGGTTVGPAITSVDLTTGTIFANSNAGTVVAEGVSPLLWAGEVVTLDEDGKRTVPAAGLLATVTLDTTGIFSGQFPFAMHNTTPLNGDTGFIIFNPDTHDVQSIGEFIDGFLTINGAPWQNPTNRFDVNHDGVVAPLDALTLINALNDGRGGSLTGAPTADQPFLDVDGDNGLFPLDVLNVINYLNAHPTAAAADLIGGQPAPHFAALRAANVPEPSSGLLAAAAAAAILLVARRRKSIL